jgi:hypothetical protein
MYDTYFLWMQCNRTGDGSTGAKPKTYTPNGYLWGDLELSNANETDERGAVRNMVTGQARLHQFPALSAKDKLVDEQFGDTYFVTGIRRDRDANETVVELERYEGVS